jgi:methionyl-tRNA formyltransferase
MRILFAGTPETAVPSLHAVLASTHDVVGVLTRPDAKAGRGRTMRSSAVADAARAAGVAVWQPENLTDPSVLQRLDELAPQCCPVVAYGALIPQRLLVVPDFGWINLHFSLLPKWRGAAPVPAALWHGDERTGACVFRIEAGLDTGPVFDCIDEVIASTDTAGELLDRLAHRGAELLVRTLDALEAGTAQATVQDEVHATFAGKLSVDDARVDWQLPAADIDRRIRACTPRPGAWTTLAGKRLRLGPVQQLSTTAPPGEVTVTASGVQVGTGTTAVTLDLVQPEGKAMMAAADWIRGLRLTDPLVLQ